MLYDHVRLKPSEQIGMHTQSSWELSYVIQGHGERHIGDKRMPFKEGDMVLVIPNMPHNWSFESETEDGFIENITVLFDGSFITDCFAHIRELEAIKDFYLNLQESILVEDSLRDEIATILRSMKQETEAQKVISLMRVLCLISQAPNAKSAGNFVHKENREDKLNRAKVYARCNYTKPIEIKDVAEHIGMSATGFCNFWKQMTGTRFFVFLIKHRLEAACQLLQDPNKSISEACFESGFNDQAYFSKTFKKRMGLSPSQYRAQLLKRKEPQ